MDSADWIYEFRRVGALWEHRGNPKQPHVCLTGGQHAGGYTNASLFPYPEHTLVELFGRTSIRNILQGVDHVTGPANGATPIISTARDILGRLNLPSDVQFSCPEKVIEGGFKSFVLDEQFRKIREGTRVLLVDDVFSTGSSLKILMELIERRGGIVVPIVITLVNQFGRDIWEGCQIVSLFSRKIKRYPADNCPLCRRGSEAIRPREGNNWSRLTAQY